MTNILKVVAAQIILTVTTNWVPIGNMQIHSPEPKSMQVQQGRIQTNTFLVFPMDGGTNWQLISVTNGEPLKDYQLIEQIPSASRQPQPLPIMPPSFAVTNVGRVRLN